MNYYLPEELRKRIRQQAGNRCGYCLSPQHLLMGALEIEHILPKAAGGADEESNLWLACRLCNGFKSSQTRAVRIHGQDALSSCSILERINGKIIFAGLAMERGSSAERLAAEQLLLHCD